MLVGSAQTCGSLLVDPMFNAWLVAGLVAGNLEGSTTRVCMKEESDVATSLPPRLSQGRSADDGATRACSLVDGITIPI